MAGNSKRTIVQLESSAGTGYRYTVTKSRKNHPERIEFKILLVTYKALNGMAPEYISELVRYCNLSGSRLPSLQTYVSKSSYGDRAFIACSAKLWNNLPEAIRTSASVEIFKGRLKTHLFKKSFPI